MNDMAFSEEQEVVTISLNEIRHGIDGEPCKNGWKKLLEALGKIKADDVPFPLEFVLDSNGIDEGLWCISGLNQRYKKAEELLICNIAESVLPIFEKDHPDNFCIKSCIKIRRNWALGDASDEEWYTARDKELGVLFAAKEGATSTGTWSAAWAALSYKAFTAAMLAQRAAERDTLFAAKGDIKWSIEGDALIVAAKQAEKEKQIAIFRDFCNLRGDYKKCLHNDDPIIPTMG